MTDVKENMPDAAAGTGTTSADLPPVEETAVETVDVAKLQAELEQAKAEAAANYDQFLRTQAELANQRRRTDKLVEDAHKYAAQKFVESLIPVIDSMEMGLQAQGDIEQIREGMQLTLKQFETVMEKFNIEAVGKPGDAFNPEHHQAMSMQPHPDFDNNTLTLVMQKGYLLNGRVVRPAMVMVCKK
ncbi:MAG TPA: nucleotide exchange factor GrpE [Candidatus Thiothrix moscowensis]|uniref:nucleotide exchange factor GrpE n=1 Tax=unclassified Thiothrix TaxID=2636184 RepID=UPI001A2F4AD3|nr:MULTISPECIES: nucleotide exchange factor GrpE [unclassified Thiothrix]MBJ6609937.1 nucleotide exchange factor GrpE [Candidatus Thiothrix moscowensis]HRJ52842.1 nucleotide exchange factor GrpE [Candidatus Thiothrix moscowensis]HRJ93392.1 nucleotide exchange factor GrpE [Candidatus Thiothrix moscowensis]